jgi:hypothetical protein
MVDDRVGIDSQLYCGFCSNIGEGAPKQSRQTHMIATKCALGGKIQKRFL